MMKKKVFMMFALLGAMAQGVWAESIKYIDRTWDEATKKETQAQLRDILRTYWEGHGGIEKVFSNPY